MIHIIINNNMKTTATNILILLGCVSQIVLGQEKVCSSFCTSLGMMESNPGKSCNDIYQINKASRGVSGGYWIQTATGTHQVYCDMELECGGYKGGWMRIADLDTSRGDDCPTGWMKVTTPTNVDVCRSNNNNPGCYQATYSTNGLSYNKVCGMARGYQKGVPDAFEAFTLQRRRTPINEPYVDGLSLTISGSPRKHIWSYGIGFSDNNAACPCGFIRTSDGRELVGPDPQEFVREHYYCESGTDRNPPAITDYLTDDPLWDGEQCTGDSQCCHDPGMPWFTRQFPSSVTGDIEARICRDQTFNDEGILIDQLQLFVQ